MKELIIITCVFVALAILVEIVYVVLKMIVDRHYWKNIERSVRIIHVYGPEEHVKPECKIHVCGDDHNDPFDLGVKVDKVRFGDEP